MKLHVLRLRPWLKKALCQWEFWTRVFWWRSLWRTTKVWRGGEFIHDWSLLIADTYRMRDRIQISFCLAIKPSPALANQPKLWRYQGRRATYIRHCLGWTMCSSRRSYVVLTARHSPSLPSHSIMPLVHLESLSQTSKARDKTVISVSAWIIGGLSWFSSWFFASGSVDRPV